MQKPKIRTGIGYDVHKLEKGESFWLGGIEIEHHKGCVGHSDGDTLIHAIADALLGAANLGDIGLHFPDSSVKYKNMDSKIILADTCKLLRKKGYEIGNIDTVIALQKPKIKPYIAKMQNVLAETMSIGHEDISIKATTTEKLGFVGEEKGIAAYANVLIFG
ncbi:MAG: 2-C-methyl-D-erythritol 2,4-cyclodiphosphate synthase [Bacteroidota bacterium]|nr:2-C-methyl-D-erythritol 2,4-cyclodiphosphate synthase [Bacteroidota bacterium]